MIYQQKLIPLENRNEWQRALTGVPHAFGHTWESCHAMHLSTRYATFLYIYKKDNVKVLCPLAERHFAGYVDIVTPYGFGGFIGQRDEKFLDQWREFSRNRGWVSAYIGLNPLFAPHTCRQQSDYQEYNDIFVLELGRNLEELYSGLSQNRRRQLCDVSTNTEWLIDDRQQLATFFLNQVAGFLAEKGAKPVYAFSRETLETLLSLDSTLLFGAGRQGRVGTVCVFATTPYCAEYLFGISLPEGRPLSAALLWHSALRLRSLGIPLLNLGGGVQRGDSVAEFKNRFGARKLPLGSLRSVFRHDVWNALCSQTGNDSLDHAGYFPAYRRDHSVAAG